MIVVFDVCSKELFCEFLRPFWSPRSHRSSAELLFHIQIIVMFSSICATRVACSYSTAVAIIHWRGLASPIIVLILRIAHCGKNWQIANTTSDIYNWKVNQQASLNPWSRILLTDKPKFYSESEQVNWISSRKPTISDHGPLWNRLKGQWSTSADMTSLKKLCQKHNRRSLAMSNVKE